MTRHNSIWQFTEEQRIINRCAMAELPKNTPERMLTVSTSYFVAGAVWKRISGIWSCVHASPILKWMKGMNKDAAKLALLKMGASWEWTTMNHGQGLAQECKNNRSPETSSRSSASRPASTRSCPMHDDLIAHHEAGSFSLCGTSAQAIRPALTPCKPTIP